MRFLDSLLSFFLGAAALLFAIYAVGIVGAVLLVNLREVAVINYILSNDLIASVGYGIFIILIAIAIIFHKHPYFSRNK